MRTPFASFVSILALVVTLLMPFGVAAQNFPYHSQRILVKFKSDSESFPRLRALAPRTADGVFSIKTARAGGPLPAVLAAIPVQAFYAIKPDADTRPTDVGIERLFVFELAEGAEVAAVCEQLNRDPEIEYAEPDYIGFGGGHPANLHVHRAQFSAPSLLTPNDPNFGLQWGLQNTGQTINGVAGTPGADIHIVPAWDITTGDNSIVAILDSGIPPGASEFAGRLMQGHDYANNDTDPTDDHGHGSNVASIAAATGNNARLIAGVNWHCRILPMKILDSNNFGFYSWWTSALVAAADSGAAVINMSVGGTGYSRSLEDGVTYAVNHGAIVVACMMNTNDDTPHYPAAFPNVIAVGATNNRDERATPFCWGGGSNYGNHIDFVAPGEMIIGLHYENPERLSYWCGTSQATPLVTGLVSLLKAVRPQLTFSETYDALKAGAVDQVGPASEDTPGWDQYFGWGRVDALRTLAAVTGVTEPDASGAVPPHRYRLYQNTPNPFNAGTSIAFDMPEAATVRLVIYDALGRQVHVLLLGTLPAGHHEVQWQANNLPSGLYLYELVVNEKPRLRRKMLLLR